LMVLILVSVSGIPIFGLFTVRVFAVVHLTVKITAKKYVLSWKFID